MTEVELRFQVPAASRRALEADVATATAQRTRLYAIYFDTPERQLAAAGLALRLRKEGRCWVQTLKAGGAYAMQRFEHNVELPRRAPMPAGSALRPDPGLHAGTEGGELLLTTLAACGSQAEASLEEVFRTDIRRCHRVLRGAGGSVELAFDHGTIIAGKQRLPVCELEIELLRGAPATVIEVARRWVARHHLWLEVRSKAERGERLAREAAPGPGPVHKAGTLHLDRTLGVESALRAVVAHCLEHVLPNASEVASGAYADEHVHQLRVGLRRLRSGLRLFDGWTSLVKPAWTASLAEVFTQLGATRDRDALLAGVVPALRAAGAPWVEIPPSPGATDPASSARASSFTQVLLDLLELTITLPATPIDSETSFNKRASQRVDAWHRKVRRDAKHFESLDTQARHTLRIRVKRLRYAVEFVESLYPAKAASRTMKRLTALQESLGRTNDIELALALYRSMVDSEPGAWFAVGWLGAQRDALLAENKAALEAFRKVKPFWSTEP